MTSFSGRPGLERRGRNYGLPLSEIVSQDSWGRRLDQNLVGILNETGVTSHPSSHLTAFLYYLTLNYLNKLKDLS
ncbi:MAG: hypothetical protein QXK17_00785 [Metallosphaera sp.]